MGELEYVLKNVSKTKSRDPDGLNRIIFHKDYIGTDLKNSLLTMFNQLKKNGIVSDFMKNATISTIPKKGSKFLFKK